jgi:hypothetical protein
MVHRIEGQSARGGPCSAQHREGAQEVVAGE